jgi:GRF zinc finger
MSDRFLLSACQVANSPIGNCNPRLPAPHFQVRKEGPNTGRWFYTCQEPKGKGCRFFLWDEDAARREMTAVMSNSRSEPAAAVEVAESRSGGSTDKRTVEGHIEASNEWMAELVKKEEDEFGDWSLSPNDETSLVGGVDKVAGAYPETPRKTVKFDIYDTPASKRKRDVADAWPTPVTGRTDQDDVFIISSSNWPRSGLFDSYKRSGLVSPSVTPTPSRFREVDPPPAVGEVAFDQDDYNITQEIMEILQGQSLEEETSAKLRQALHKHALRTQGIVKGRDVTRLALKSKEAKIVELQQRITALETERDMDKLVIKHFKSDMAHSVSRRGRGRGRGRPPDT